MTLWSHSSPSASPPVLREPVVYVVDDDASMRQALDGLLRSIGLQVQTFETSQDFLASAKRDVPGCLVLDVRLRGESGLTFQEQMEKTGVRIPIVFMTGHGDIAMTGHEYDGNAHAGLFHLLLKGQAAFTPQAHIEHQTTGDIAFGRCEKILGGFEGLHLQADRTQQTVESLTHGGVVVDHINHRFPQHGRACAGAGMRPQSHRESSARSQRVRCAGE